MRQSLLIKTIALLSTDELSELAHFVRSGYFNRGKRARQVEVLYDFLVGHAPDFSSLPDGKDDISAALFPGKSASELQKTMSELQQVVEKFVAWRQTFGQSNGSYIRHELAMLRFMYERNCEDNARSIGKLLRDFEADTPIKDTEYYYHRYQLENELSRVRTQFNTKSDDLNLGAAMRSLDVFYLIAQLENACLLVVQSWLTHINTEGPLRLLEAMMAGCRDDDFAEAPLLGILRNAFELLGKPDDGDLHFRELSEKLQISGHTVPFSLRVHLNAYLRNYCTRRYNQGDNEFLHTLFGLHEQHLADGTLYQNGLLLPGTLQNIVNVALKLGENDWVLRFLQAHRDRIGGTTQPDEVYRLNLANYYLATRQYALATDTLPQQYHDTQYEQAARRLEIKAFFETHSPLLPHKLNAFKVFIHREHHRQNISDNVYEANNNFLKVVTKLDQMQLITHRTEREKQVLKINRMKAVAEREWLLEKLQRSR